MRVAALPWREAAPTGCAPRSPPPLTGRRRPSTARRQRAGSSSALRCATGRATPSGRCRPASTLRRRARPMRGRSKDRGRPRRGGGRCARRVRGAAGLGRRRRRRKQARREGRERHAEAFEIEGANQREATSRARAPARVSQTGVSPARAPASGSRAPRCTPGIGERDARSGHGAGLRRRRAFRCTRRRLSCVRSSRSAPWSC